jgi:hypothetical protein
VLLLSGQPVKGRAVTSGPQAVVLVAAAVEEPLDVEDVADELEALDAVVLLPDEFWPAAAARH